MYNPIFVLTSCNNVLCDRFHGASFPKIGYALKRSFTINI